MKEPPAQDWDELARASAVAAWGRQGAGWLLCHEPREGSARKLPFWKLLRANGIYDFDVPKNDPFKKAAYVHYAMQFLGERKLWSVEKIARGERVVYRLRWLGWKGWKRLVGIPRELVTQGDA